MKSLKEIKKELEKNLPPELVGRLFEHYKEIKDNYYLGKYEPSELNAGKFVEVVYRLIESQINTNGSFTPLEAHIPDIVGKLRAFENKARSAGTEPLRRHIPRVLISVIEIRNNRGVGHTSGRINPNYLDSTFLVTACDWVFADLVREYCGFSPSEAQSLVDSIIERKIPIVFEFEEVLRVLTPMSHKEKVLVLLKQFYGRWVQEKDLFSWTEHSNITHFRKLLVKLHKEKLIEYDRANGRVVISPKGIKTAEEIIAKHI